MTNDTHAPVYRLRITLGEIEPPVLRRVEIAGDTTLQSLHVVLVRAVRSCCEF